MNKDQLQKYSLPITIGVLVIILLITVIHFATGKTANKQLANSGTPSATATTSASSSIGVTDTPYIIPTLKPTPSNTPNPYATPTPTLRPGSTPQPTPTSIYAGQGLKLASYNNSVTCGTASTVGKYPDLTLTYYGDTSGVQQVNWQVYLNNSSGFFGAPYLPTVAPSNGILQIGQTVVIHITDPIHRNAHDDPSTNNPQNSTGPSGVQYIITGGQSTIYVTLLCNNI